MAEVRKKREVEKYKIDETQFHKDEKKKEKASDKKVVKKVVKQDNSTQEKKSAWVRFRIFCHGVIFCSLFFYAIEVIFALIQSIFR